MTRGAGRGADAAPGHGHFFHNIPYAVISGGAGRGHPALSPPGQRARQGPPAAGSNTTSATGVAILPHRSR
jgi:hypothetical protein